MNDEIFKGQSVIDAETGLPATPERLAEIRSMLLAQGIKLQVPDEIRAQLEAEGFTVEQAEAEIWGSLGGLKS